MLKLLKLIIHMFYPSRCPMCGKIVAEDNTICADCDDAVTEITPPVCKKCGSSLKDCLCSRRQNVFQSVVAPYYYSGSVKRGVKRFKYKNIQESANFFISKTSELVKREYCGYKIDVITFVPMIKQDYIERGFNPSQILAKGISKELGIPSENLLKKIYQNKKQHSLHEDERAGNVLGVFDVTDSELVIGKTVLLCDDIITTGATLDECTKMLYFAGANTVLCACVAKTPPPNKQK